MRFKYREFHCPLCKRSLGQHDERQVLLLVCEDPDCMIEWCFRPRSKLPVALRPPLRRHSKGEESPQSA